MEFKSLTCFLDQCAKCPIAGLSNQLNPAKAVDQVLQEPTAASARHDGQQLRELSRLAAENFNVRKWHYVISRAAAMALKQQCPSRK